MLLAIDDLRDFDAHLRTRSGEARARLRELLSGHRLTLREARVHNVLMPMVGLYTPGWQALPAWSWGFVELVTNEGPVGTGEWSVAVDQPAHESIERLRAAPSANLLDDEWEIPLFMAWWDLVGQTLQKPLHQLWAELFDVGFAPPSRVPLAAYSWQRFPDAEGRDAVTFESWPQFAAQQVAEGFSTLKLSMTSYEPDDHVELVARIREAIPPEVDIRVDAHGTWNAIEARRIMRALEPYRVSYIEQPLASLLPQRFYAGAPVPERPGGGFQREYYFRKLEELRRDTALPISCHWWTPPIVQPAGVSRAADAWEFDWYLIERYDPVNISVPDIGLGVFGLWRLFQMTRFMGLHLQIHSNSELGLQQSMRAAMFAALGYYPESAGLYLGTMPRLCVPMDTEYNQVRDDVLAGGKLPLPDGHIELSPEPGHGRALDPERLERYRWTEERARAFREHATAVREHYLLDRPRRRTMSGWPKPPGPERFDRQAYPYDLTQMLGGEQAQDVDVELNT
ncbi:MAG: mandelate racemase/muconate lactonizing enzyme family protein [Actinomycetota bacterium]|nr:mandelate racemase/muconate lactonizing enzyme family protein [Actinomycetota bacterium]